MVSVTSVEAAVISFTGSGTGAGGANLQAQADFDITGSTLTITLANTVANDNNSGGQDVPGNTLSGVFFNLTGNPTLTPVSATLPAGSSIIQTSRCALAGACSTTNVGGEFGYAKYASYPSPRGSQGIGSAGYITGNSANFGGVDLGNNHSQLDGIDFGIISLDPSYNPNGDLSSRPLIKNSVIFVLTIPGPALTTADISSVAFQYGTAFSDTHAIVSGTQQVIPEPSTLLLLGSG